MTRLIAISTTLLLLLGISIGGLYYAGGTKTGIDEKVKAALAYCDEEDIEGLKKESNAMTEFLESRHSVLSLYVRHDEIEKLQTHLIDLSGYVSLASFDSAKICLMEIKFMANHIYEREYPSVDILF